MKIIYKFKDVKMGVLTFENNKFIYNSYPNGEEEAKNLSLGILDYHLFNSKNKTSSLIFPEFIPWLKLIARNDIVEFCEINQDDDEWTILCKLAKNNAKNGAYNIELINN